MKSKKNAALKAIRAGMQNELTSSSELKISITSVRTAAIDRHSIAEMAIEDPKIMVEFTIESAGLFAPNELPT